MMLAFTDHLCVLVAIAVYSVATTNNPEISIHHCSPPMKFGWTLCCVTENLHLATITVNHQQEEIAVIRPSCNITTSYSKYKVSCSVEGATRVLMLRVEYINIHFDLGLWSCNYYGGSASLELRSYQVLDDFVGDIFANKSGNAVMKFAVKDPRNATVYNPRGEVILTSSGSLFQADNNIVSHVILSTGNVSFTLANVTFQDNGTYVCTSGMDEHTTGLSLVVLGKLDRPTIAASDISGIPSVSIERMTLTCTVQSTAAADYYYTPKFHVNWIYPDKSETDYIVTQNGSQLIVQKIDCKIGHSQPIFCCLQENTGPVSEDVHFYPHILCSYTNVTGTTDNPVIVKEVDKPDSDRGNLIAVGVVGMVGFWIFGVMFFAGKKRVGRCCKCWCELIRKCCAKTLCRKCCRNFEDDEFYSDYFNDVMRDSIEGRVRREENNWDNIVNVYSPGIEPNVALPPPPNRDNEGNNIDDDEDSGMDERRNSSPSPAGAEGVDRNVLIKEIESCFKSLQKTLRTDQSQIQVSRDNLVQNMFDIYTDPAIVDSYLHVKMIGEEGSDWGGVSRDLFTSFWNEVSHTFFQGQDALVPYLPPHKLEDEYKFRLLGRILSHSTAILGYIPIPLCKSVIMVTILDTTNIDEDALLEDYLLYLDTDDRALVISALTDFSSLSDEESDRLQNLFIQNDMGCLLQEGTFRKQLLKMARNELCIKPRSLCGLVKEGIPEVHFHTFWLQMTIDHLKILNDRLKPSAEKVIACFRPDIHSMTPRREKIYGYFLDIIKTLPQEDLETLLQFITGQAGVPRRNIKIEFSDLRGAERRLIAHTCSYSLEVPDTYTSYEEFHQEFTHFIKSDIIRFDTQ